MICPTIARIASPFSVLTFVIAACGGHDARADSDSLLNFTIVPAAQGEQIVRTSLPFAEGKLLTGDGLIVRDGKSRIKAAVRPLTWYGDGRSDTVRRALITFPYRFKNRRPVRLSVSAAPPKPSSNDRFPVAVHLNNDNWLVAYASGLKVRARPVWPALRGGERWQRETVEKNKYYRWDRWKAEDDQWGRIVEVRADALGQVTLIARLQRREARGDWLPRFGWDLVGTFAPANERAETDVRFADDDALTLRHSFASGRPFAYSLERGDFRIEHPRAPWTRSGAVFTSQGSKDEFHYQYLRAGDGDRVPLQLYAWRRAECVLGPANLASPTPTLCSPHTVRLDWRVWNALYDVGRPLDLSEWPQLAWLDEFHRDATVDSAAVGHDYGNLTSYNASLPHGGVLGMNRLNHCPAIFFEAMRSGDQRLTETAVAWCDNFYDLTIWWGPKNTGGTRYNNIRAIHETPPEDDKSFMWRSDRAVDFCTKGYDSFLLAYEETGDPRMMEALEAQCAYAAEHVHADESNGEARNIGDVAGFIRLYEFTGEKRFLDLGHRLFRELRATLNADNLFSQSGKPIVPDPPYIEEDEVGKKHPFAKPYIIGYALAGCPRLARYAPDEPRLKDMIRAVADFLAESQDPVGGWRYPHPKSSTVIMSQAMEHASQLVQACEVTGAKDNYLDAIERVLRQRLWTWKTSGEALGTIRGWEISTGRVSDPLKMYGLYQHPADRDATRDYREGQLAMGLPPEGTVYFPEVLRFYLKHRPAERLFSPPAADSPLGEVVARLAAKPMLQTTGIRDGLPIFYERLSRRSVFPLSWDKTRWPSFEAWQKAGRHRVRETWLTPPPNAPFDATVIATRQCDGYESQKLAFNLSGDSRVLAYLLVPDGPGPFPAVLLLHDHGAEFRIGKEKLIEPWDERPEKIELAHQWTKKYYGGRFLGDELARRGYVCLAVDALNWSSRGGAGFDGQQQLASNLMHFGMSFAGLIAQEDVRAAAFLAQRPEVDRKRIVAMGLSMGGFRAWQVAAMSPEISAGVAVCWMATTEGLMKPGNNQTKGHSAFTMLHPGLHADMDYPDVASLACPKPMLFYNGRQDKLFPVASVEEAYEKMQAVWHSQGVENSLVTKLWDTPHVFNREMQDAAFDWLDRVTATARRTENRAESGR